MNQPYPQQPRHGGGQPQWGAPPAQYGPPPQYGQQHGQQSPYYGPPAGPPYQPPAPVPPRKPRFGLGARIAMIVGAIVLIGTIGNAVNGDDEPAPAASSSTPAVPGEPAAPAPEAAPLRVGDTVDVEGLQLTVADLRDGDDTFGETSCVTVTYLNNSDDEQSFNTFDWELRDTQGVEVTSGFFGSDNALGSGNLRPGGTKAGDVCFDFQGGGAPESVVYTGSLFGGREDIVWAAG